MTTTMTTGVREGFEPFLVPLEGAAEALRAVIEPALALQGLELVQLQLVRGMHRDTLRVFVDHRARAAKDDAAGERRGISVAELEQANRLLSDLLDVEDNEQKLFAHRWDLEVSSPGLDRPLTKRSHFGHAIGERVKVKLNVTAAPLPGGARGATGALTGADADGIALAVDATTSHRIPFADIHSAHVVFVFEEPDRPHKKPQQQKQPHQQPPPKKQRVKK